MSGTLTCPICRFENVETAKFCNNCGSPLEPARSIVGERKFASVLFADVARSTAIAEQLDPEDWALIMNGAFGFMNVAVSQYGGTVSRLMGDAVLALFGAPVAHEDDAERAVRAGLEIQHAAGAYAKSVKQRHGVDFELRVGINTGTAVLAFVGDAIKTEYTAMGDVANIAARLQAAAEPGTVLISADTQKLVHALFDFKPRGAIEMRGKSTAVASFEVLGAKAVPGKTRGLEGLNSPLVGREKEFDLLREKLLALDSGIGSVVAITGEAGLGKSRLVAELRQLLSEPRDKAVAWFESRAISYGQSIPYYAWRQIGRQMVGSTEMDAAPVLRDKLQEFVKALALPARDVSFLETMLAVDTEASRLALADLGGEALVDGVAGAVVNVVKSAIRPAAGVQPLVLVMDDLHWSDSATLELIAQVATLASVEPLLMVCVLRPDRKAASWQLVDRLQASLGSAFDRLDLEPLNPSDAGTLLGHLLHVEDLPESIRAKILERSEGNPFYLEEVLRSLIDCGQVVREEGHWRATRDIVDATIPETLAGVLSARIDRLPETTKRVAQTAAVIGRVFMHRVLESVCRAAPGAERVEHVEPHIATLSYEQLVRERSRDPEREYIFKHAMTCEAAYGLLLRSRRRELHARAGAALEALFSERRDEFAPMLAHHFAEAEDLERAFAYSMRAADSARKLYALNEELEHRERALNALERMPSPQPPAVIDATIDWTLVRHRLNSYEGVLERLATAVALARSSGDKERLASTLSWTGNIHMVTGFPTRSFPFLEESQKLAASLGNERLLLLPLFVATWTLVDRDPGKAVGQLQEVIDQARKHDVPDVLAHAVGFRAVALARLGEFDAARAEVQEALALAPRAGSPVKEADVHIAASMAYYDMGEIEKGLEQARIGAEKALGANGIECACAGYFNVGRGQLERGRPEEAILDFGKSLSLANSVGWDGYLNLIRGGVAVAEFEQGTAEKAIEELRGAIKDAESGHDDYAVSTLSSQLAKALFRLGRRDEAAQYLDAAISYYRARRMRPYLASALDLAAKVYAASDKSEQAAQAQEEATALHDVIAAGHQGKLPEPVARV
ncbi:MAG TPA: adenylate/guanylate cyclase domain-containing protein [Arsenicitalea sp.]|jgi:class 3 adenylate cyclase/tetratricopeptide (TPR) repeat protein|nr:adenylate/guanylate cyclase domain-containing protein [Arsenicitalea sp.]